MEGMKLRALKTQRRWKSGFWQGRESSWQSREALPYCRPAHEGSFLQHTAVIPAPWREDESVWGTLLLWRGSEKPQGLLEYFMWRWSWLLGSVGLGSWAGWVWTVLKPAAKSSVAAWHGVGCLCSWALPAHHSKFGQKCSEPKFLLHWHVHLAI